jgi:hypothetical protein
MALEHGAFKVGAVEFPLTESTTNSLLQDADPALYHSALLLASALETYVGDRLLAQAAMIGLNLQGAVVKTVSLDPVEFLLHDQFKFPLFCLYRTKDTWSDLAQVGSKSASTWNFSYVLPPLNPTQQLALHPILRAVSVTLRRTVTMGWDPSYNDGEKVWDTYGVQKARLTEATYGGIEKMVGDAGQFYRSLTGTIVVEEREVPLPSAFRTFTGVNADLDVGDGDGTLIESFVEFETASAPTIVSVNPATGSSDGGETVIIEGTGFRVGTRPSVLFDGASADAVEVLSSTAIQCVTPAHNAFPSFAADVMVVATDGHTATLADAFTFEAP